MHFLQKKKWFEAENPLQHIDIQGENTLQEVCKLLFYSLFLLLTPADRATLVPDISSCVYLTLLEWENSTAVIQLVSFNSGLAPNNSGTTITPEKIQSLIKVSCYCYANQSKFPYLGSDA